MIDFAEIFGDTEATRRKSLVEILEEQSLKTNLKRMAPGKNLRASGFGGCLRALLYKSRGYEEAVDVGAKLTFEQGHAIHAELQKLLTDAGIMISSEDEVVTVDEDVRGHYDGHIRYLGESILEIKSVGYGQFERLFKFGKRQISKRYKIQAHLYMKAKGVDKTVFLFVNKNRQCSEEFSNEFPGANQQFLEIVVEFDQSFYDIEIVKRKQEFDSHYDSGTMPARVKCGECDYCPFASHCKSDYELEKAIAKSEAKALKHKEDSLGVRIPKPRKSKKNGV